jgi:ribosomal protein L16/L10AE
MSEKDQDDRGTDATITDAELAWLHNGLNAERLAKLSAAEIEEARTATSRPRHWVPIEVDDALLR